MRTSPLLIGILCVLACDARRAQTPDPAPGVDATLTPAPKPPVDPTPPKPARPLTALEVYTQDLTTPGDLHVTISTTEGDITCRLFEGRAPQTVTNFVGLARGKKTWIDPDSASPIEGRPYFDGHIFHRVIPGFIIQTGDPTGTGTGGPGFSLQDEFHPELRHDRPGILSMANAGPDTGGSQFFITEGPAVHLDDKHSVFGLCQDIEVIRTIARTPADPTQRPEHPPSISKMSFFRRTP